MINSLRTKISVLLIIQSLKLQTRDLEGQVKENGPFNLSWKLGKDFITASKQASLVSTLDPQSTPHTSTVLFH